MYAVVLRPEFEVFLKPIFPIELSVSLMISVLALLKPDFFFFLSFLAKKSSRSAMVAMRTVSSVVREVKVDGEDRHECVVNTEQTAGTGFRPLQ